MPAKSRNNAPEALLPPPPPPQQGPASHSAGRGNRQSNQPPSANPFEFYPPPPADESTGKPLTAANFPPASIAHSHGRKLHPKHSRAPSNPFAHLPPPPADRSSGRPLPPPPLYKGDGMPLLYAPPPPAQGVSYPHRLNKVGNRAPTPPANVHIVSLPTGGLPSSAQQGAPKKTNGRRKNRKSQQSIAGQLMLHGPPQVGQRPYLSPMYTSDDQYSDIASNSFYDPPPVTNEPASKKGGPHGSRSARRQSSILSFSSDASLISIGSTDSQYTTLQEEEHVDKRRENLVKIKTFRSPRYGMDTEVDVIPIEPGRISKTMSVLGPKKEFSPKQRFKVTPLPARDDHYRMRPSAARK